MNTQKLESEIVNYLSGIEDATTIASTNFEDPRDGNMVVVNITSCVPLNVGYLTADGRGVPDWQVTGQIQIHCMIADDADGKIFRKITQTVQDRLMVLHLRDVSYDEIFPETHRVCAFFLDGVNMMLLEEENTAYMTFRIIVSE